MDPYNGSDNEDSSNWEGEEEEEEEDQEGANEFLEPMDETKENQYGDEEVYEESNEEILSLNNQLSESAIQQQTHETRSSQEQSSLERQGGFTEGRVATIAAQFSNTELNPKLTCKLDEKKTIANDMQRERANDQTELNPVEAINTASGETGGPQLFKEAKDGPGEYSDDPNRGRARGRRSNRSCKQRGRGGRGSNRGNFTPSNIPPETSVQRKRSPANENTPRRGHAKKHFQEGGPRGRKHYPERHRDVRSESPHAQVQYHRQPTEYGQRQGLGFPEHYEEHGGDEYDTNEQDRFYDAEDYGTERRQYSEGGYECGSYRYDSHKATRRHDLEGQYYDNDNPQMWKNDDYKTKEFEEYEHQDDYYNQYPRGRRYPRGRGNYAYRGSRDHSRGGPIGCQNYGKPVARCGPHRSQSPVYFAGDKDGHNSEDSSIPLKIEVSGFSPSIDEEILMLYFENTRKSGGGNIKDFQMNPANTSASITFEEPAAADRVLKKSHVVKGSNLTVVKQKPIEKDHARSQARKIEVSGFDSSMDQDMLMMYFENERKSGGGEIKTFHLNRANLTATIVFADLSVTDRVLKKTHRLSECKLTVTEKTEEEGNDDDGKDSQMQDSSGRVLEVSGFKASTSEDMLMMYFENTRRSGGGEIKEIQMNTKKNRAAIIFTDQTVIDRVLKKSHKLEGANLMVVVKKAQPIRPIDTHRLFLKGMPEDIQQETLMLFLENRTKIPEDPTIVYGEQPGTAMLYYEQEIADIDSVIKKIGEKKLKGSILIASHVKSTDCILVQSLKPKTSRDMIELYFENQRKSGGGAVSDVELNEEENKAFVFFEDWTTVNKVTGRRHTLLGQSLTVTAHYECLGTVVSTEGPVPVIPKPIPHNVDQDLMEHVMGKHFSLLAEEMKKTNADIAWPHEGDKSHVLFKPVPIDTDDRSVWRQWKNNVSKRFSSFLQKFNTEPIEVPRTIWADLSDMLLEIEIGSVDLHQRADKSTIILTGMAADVKTAKEIISKTIQELKDKAEREAQTIEKTLKLSPLKMKLFSVFAINEELCSRFPEVHINVLSDNNEIAFKGIRGEISESQVAMYGIFESLSKRIVETNASVFEFVELSCDIINGILSSKKVTAMCNIDEGKITVYGKVASHTEKAMNFLRKDIISKTMPIGKESVMAVLQSQSGSDKIKNLNDTSEIIIHVDITKRQIRVTGLTDKVETSIVEIGQFIDENVIIEKLVPCPPLHVKYVLANCDRELSEIRKQYPKVDLLPEIKGRNSGFMMKGTERGTDAVKDMFGRLMSTVVERTHRIDKPGMPELLRDQRGQRYLKTVAHDCECLIDTDNYIRSGETVGKSDTPAEILCQYTTPDGYRLVVCKGDLTKENVDAIVNAANPGLQHVGGLAKAISEAGGESIQQESNLIIKQRGRNLATSEAVCTGAGHLPCRHVIHVSGPVWSKSRRRDKRAHSSEEDLLYDAVTNSLREAHDRKLKSIALPAISAGVFGFPIKLCAKTVMEATSDFIAQYQPTLKEIRFTNITVEHSVAFQNALKERFGKDVVEGSPATTEKSETRLPMDGMYLPSKMMAPTANLIPVINPTTCIMFNKKSTDTITTKEGKEIMLKKGSLADEQADVIVNTTAGEMDLTRGNVSKALLQAAGQGLQQECDAKVTQSDGKRRDVIAGDFIVTGPANLKCKKVFHSHCPGYKETDAAKVLKSMIEKLLLEASKSGMTSIAIPAIGTGNLGFPKDVVARVMYEGVAQFSKDNPTSSLKDIRFWVYDKDLPTIQAFETEMQRRTAPAPTHDPTMDTTVPQKKKKAKRKMKKSESALSRSLTDPSEDEIPFVKREIPIDDAPSAAVAFGPSETKFGSVTVQVQQGDLATETSEAIVNTVGKDLALKGVVSRALIRAGGNVIADECEQIRTVSKSIPHIAKTTAGKLPSKYIIHVYLSKPDMVKKMAREILQLAEKEGIHSIAFPALGTGNLGGSAHQVAPELIDAIGEFANNDQPTTVKTVRLTIFQHDMIPVFEETLKSKAGASFKKPERAWKRGIKAAAAAMFGYATGGTDRTEVPESGTAPAKTDAEKDTMTLSIVAREERKLDQAVAMIEDFIQDEFYSEEVVPEGVEQELAGNILRSIKQIGQKHKVTVAALPGNKSILLEGAKVSVLSTKADIQTEFARIQAEEKRKAKDELLSKNVQWRYQSDTGIYDDYDEELNAAIERAYQLKEAFLDLDLEDGKVRIDFNKMIEIDVAGSRPDMQINRADLKAESSTVPPNWIPMADGQNLQVVPLVQGSPEYNKAESTFKSGNFNHTIVKIERIQNKEIYTQYSARKESMKARLGKDTERILFHGTSEDTVEKINMRGFNRSYSGKNAVAFGQGTYFARDVTYSAQDRYSRRDAKNQKYIYMCRVLVGDCERGSSDMVVPHQKPGSLDIYDSTVDNVQNPSIVVIYHDTQAYPEYLVTFT